MKIQHLHLEAKHRPSEKCCVCRGTFLALFSDPSRPRCHVTALGNQVCVGGKSPIFQRRKLRLRKVKQSAEGHTISKRLSWTRVPGSLPHTAAPNCCVYGLPSAPACSSLPPTNTLSLCFFLLKHEVLSAAITLPSLVDTDVENSLSSVRQARWLQGATKLAATPEWWQAREVKDGMPLRPLNALQNQPSAARSSVFLREVEDPDFSVQSPNFKMLATKLNFF